MFKKAKLYSLLAIIVASTAVSLFSLQHTANAQEVDPNIATWGPGQGGSINRKTIQYGGALYDRITDLSATYVKTSSENYCELDDKDWFETPTNPNNEDNVYVKVPGSNPDDDSLSIIFFASDIDSDAERDEAQQVGFIQEENFSEVQQIAGEVTYCNPGAATYVTFDSKIVEPDEPPDDGEGGDGDEEEVPSSCQIKGIGWIICPVVNFLGEVTDQAYQLLNSKLLKLEPIVLPGSGQSGGMQLYEPWKAMRDFANIIFIIGFLIIVFSQITNIGVSNYGIKRLLPKIIIAAILVNISYFICAIAVDLSNILGNSLRGVLMPDEGLLLEFNFIHDEHEFAGQGWQGLTGVVIGAGAVAAIGYVFLPVFLPLIASAALAVVTVVIALTLRQALIVILIIVSPLAFVALLLPNTEDYFKKWRSLFTAMLMVYPIISVVFGASALASNILMNATDDFWTQMVGAGVSIIPLFITPIIMKVSGGLLNRWVGLVNNPNRGPIDGMRKSLQGSADQLNNSRKIESLNGGGRRFGGLRYRRAARKDAINSGVAAEASRETNQFVAEEIQRDRSFAQSVAGSNDPAARERAEARARSTVDNAEHEEVKAARITIDHLDAAGLEGALNAGGNSDARIAAILERLVKVGDTDQIQRVVDTYGGGGQQTVVTKSLAGALQQDGPQWLKASDIDNIARGQMGGAGSFETMTRNNLAGGVMSENKMVSENAGNLAYASRVAEAATTAGDSTAEDNLRDTAQRLFRNENLRGSIKHNQKPIEHMAGETLRSVIAASASPSAAPAATPTTPPAPGTPTPTTPPTPTAPTAGPAATPPTPPPPGYTARPSGIFVPSSSAAPPAAPTPPATPTPPSTTPASAAPSAPSPTTPVAPPATPPRSRPTPTTPPTPPTPGAPAPITPPAAPPTSPAMRPEDV